MSIEETFVALTTAVNRLASTIESSGQSFSGLDANATDLNAYQTNNGGISRPQEPVEPVTPPAPTPVPVQTPEPAPEPIQPVTTAPPVQTAPAAAPFTDKDGMNKYIMDVYQQLGAVQGARIGDVLRDMQFDTVLEVPVEQYGDFYQRVEALRASVQGVA